MRTLISTSRLGTKKNPVTEVRTLLKEFRIFASCSNGTIYQLYPAVEQVGGHTRVWRAHEPFQPPAAFHHAIPTAEGRARPTLSAQPVHEAHDSVSIERRHYGCVGIVCGVTDYAHYVGLALTVNNTNWPPALEGWRGNSANQREDMQAGRTGLTVSLLRPARGHAGLFARLYMYSNTVSGESWARNYWLAHFGVAGLLCAVVGVTLTDYMAREEFNWKFGTSSAGVKVGFRLWAMVRSKALFVDPRKPAFPWGAAVVPTRVRRRCSACTSSRWASRSTSPSRGRTSPPSTATRSTWRWRAGASRTCSPS